MISLIEFKVTNSMFRKGYLHLRCTASISNIYRKSADIEISEDTPRIASITGESPPYGHRKYSILLLSILILLSLKLTSDRSGKIVPYIFFNIEK